METRSRSVTRASLVSLAGNAVLAVAKIFVGFLSGSLAVIGDGIDSSTDVVISIVALLASRLSAKPSDREHPYGHGRAETIATVILSFVIFYAGIQLLITSVTELARGTVMEIPAPLAIWVTCFSVVGKILLSWNQTSVGKRVGSSLLVANGMNMRNDVIMSSSVLVGLLLTRVLGLPVVDKIVAILVSLWVMRSSVLIFFETNAELMDGTSDDALYRTVFEAVRSVPGAGNPHRARVRQIANAYDIDLDIEVDGSMSVRDSHEIAMKVERAIKARIDSVFDIVVHVEPSGGGRHAEQYGLDEKKLEEDAPGI